MQGTSERNYDCRNAEASCFFVHREAKNSLCEPISGCRALIQVGICREIILITTAEPCNVSYTIFFSFDFVSKSVMLTKQQMKRNFISRRVVLRHIYCNLFVLLCLGPL